MNSWIRFVTLYILATFLIFPCQGRCSENWFDKGLEALWSQKYDDAIKAFSKVVEADPGCVDAYNNRAVAWIQKGEYDRAMDDYNEALKIDPECAEMYNNRGAIWFYRGNYQGAIDDYTKALETDPRFFKAYANRGNAWFHKGNHEKALSDYKKALEINPNSVETSRQMSWIRSAMKDSGSSRPPLEPEKGNKIVGNVPAHPDAGAPSPESSASGKSPPIAGPGFSVQAGAFQSEENAQKLARLLKRKGYEARVLPFISFSKQPRYAVRIGTYDTRQEAQEKAADFSEKEKMPSIVRPADEL